MKIIPKNDRTQIQQMNIDLTAWGFPEDSTGIPKTIEELTEFVNRYYMHK